MPSRKLIMLCVLVFSVIGGYIPVLLGGSSFSFTSLITSGIGGVAGIWVAFKISKL